MELYTLTSGFIKDQIIDSFESAIWTERYVGDGDFQLTVPVSSYMFTTLAPGRILMCKGSSEPMILETWEIKDGLLKTTGISLTQWLNNRIIRTSPDHKVKEWLISGMSPGAMIAHIVQQMCIDGDYLDGTTDIGIPLVDLEAFKIPGLQIGDTDTSGDNIEVTVPFGPVYDPIKEIATTYNLGMRIDLGNADEIGYILLFVTYRGEDRTSDQDINPVVRFSSDMGTFTNITDLQSISDQKNLVFMWASNPPTGFSSPPGQANDIEYGVDPPGFQLRVSQGYSENIPTDIVDTPTIFNLLNQEALKEIQHHKPAKIVDGEMVQDGQIVYGMHYHMGDIVEVEGNTGVRQNARVTEYIRSQDGTGERSYPTLTMID